ncbi:MAG: glycoside hydrolase family 18 protein [Candidatus Sulfotelmatobacter sp.]
MHRGFFLLAAIALALVTLIGCGSSSSSQTIQNPPPPPNSSYVVAGYYPEWNIYSPNSGPPSPSNPPDFVPKDLIANGAAPLLTHLIYAFATISNNQCASADPVADYGYPLPANYTVDGVADSTASGAFTGNFHQLQELKQLYPNLQIMVSIGGGGSSSDVFSTAAEPANVQAFVASCINMFINGQFASAIIEPGIFTGIDIDWEFPGQSTVNTPAVDEANFTAMMAEFRTQLDAINPNSVLTTTGPAGSWAWQSMNLGVVQSSVNFINLMNYDFDGPWSTATGFVAPLYQAPLDPDSSSNASYAVQSYVGMGVPKNKIVFGMPFYAYEWGNVSNQNNGLFEPCTPTAGSSSCPNNTYEYNALAGLSGYTTYRDSATQEPWLWDGNSSFVTYDDPTSLAFKAQYVASQDLGGVMIWELSGDTTSGSLIQALAGSL